MESIKWDILGCTTVAAIKPSQGNGPAHREERMSPSISGETTSFASWMLLPLHLPLLTSGYKMWELSSVLSRGWELARREVLSITGTLQHHEHWAGRRMWKRPMGHPGPTTKDASGGGGQRLLQK